MARTTAEVGAVTSMTTKTRSHIILPAIACEVLARRAVHRLSPERLTAVMSTRYRHLEWDGGQSDLTSALELAIDTHR